ncbi:MAG: EAL domain-containing protein [Candidatus Thiodiazotropha taylori]
MIAEGVESQTQIDQLNSAGCHLAQGFYYSRPLPEDEFLQVFKSQPNPIN